MPLEEFFSILLGRPTGRIDQQIIDQPNRTKSYGTNQHHSRRHDRYRLECARVTNRELVGRDGRFLGDNLCHSGLNDLGIPAASRPDHLGTGLKTFIQRPRPTSFIR